MRKIIVISATLALISVYAAISGCKEKTDYRADNISELSIQDYRRWGDNRWIMVGAMLSNYTYREIVIYDPLTKSSSGFFTADGYLSSIAVGKSLNLIACAYRETRDWKQRSVLRIFKHLSKPGEILFASPITEEILSLAWSPDAKYLAFLTTSTRNEIVEPTEFNLCVINASTGHVTRYGKISCWISLGNYISGSGFLNCPLVWSSNGKALYYATRKKELMLLDLQTGKATNVGQACIPVMEEADKILVVMDNPLRLQQVSHSSRQVQTFFSIGGVDGVGRCLVAPDKQMFGIYYTKGYCSALLICNSDKKILGSLHPPSSFVTLLGWCIGNHEAGKL